MSILSLYKISKSFPRKKVLDDVSISFESGHIYALLGENGAGKSTLASVLTGNLRADGGKILLDGAEIDKDGLEKVRIAAVNQIPELVDSISVIDNCILGAEPSGRSGIIRRGEARKKLDELCEKWNTGSILSKKTYTLTAQERFFAAFLSALYRKPDWLILDEPSATLSSSERASLFEKLTAVVKQDNTCSAELSPGITEKNLCVIFITHDIQEAVRYSDAVYVLRDGVVSAQFESDSLKGRDPKNVEKDIYSAMFNETDVSTEKDETPADISHKDDSLHAEVSQNPTNQKTGNASSDVILEFSGVSASPYRKASLYDVSFALKNSSVTCITGQKEAGLETLEDIVTGMSDYAVSGEIRFMGIACKKLTPILLREHGAGIVPSDKTHRASSPHLSVRDILTARYGRETDIIKASGIDILPEEPVSNLSGGMLQSLIIERELSIENGFNARPLLIFANPVYGLDRRRTHVIIRRIKEEAQKGAAVLVLTTEGSEVEKIADITYKLVSGVLSKVEAASPIVADNANVHSDRISGAAPLPNEDDGFAKKMTASTAHHEKKITVTKKRVLNLHPLYALLSGFVAAAALILLMAKNPWQTLLSFFTAPVSSAFYAGNWLNTATLLLAAALGAYTSITAGSINLGGEGQVYAGGFVAALVLGYLPELPVYAAIPMLILAAVLSAAASTAMMAVPAVLKTHRNIEVLLSSFLLSGAVIPCIDSAITNVFRAKDGNLLATPFLNQCFRLSQILKPSSLNISIFVVLIIAALFLFILTRTKTGRVFRITGSAPAFAQLSGFNVKKNFVSGMLLSGSLHGLCGFLAVTGTHFTCHSGFYSGFGWNALTAALIAGKNPAMLIPSVLVLSFIYTGCEKTVLTGSMNPDMTFIIQAVILLFVTVQKHASGDKK